MPSSCFYVRLISDALLLGQTTLTANVRYYIVIDGFNGAYGQFSISIVTTDGSTLAGQLIPGNYALATSGTATSGFDPFVPGKALMGICIAASWPVPDILVVAGYDFKSTFTQHKAKSKH